MAEKKTSNLKANITISEGVSTPPSKPLTGTPIDHIGTKPDWAGTLAQLNLSTDSKTKNDSGKPMFTASAFAGFTNLNEGITGDGATGHTKRGFLNFTLRPDGSVVDSVHAWAGRREFRVEGKEDFNLESYGAFLKTKPITLGADSEKGDTELSFGSGLRLGDLNSAMAQAVADLKINDKLFTEAGYIKYLDHGKTTEGEETFVGVGYKDDKTLAKARQYFGEKPRFQLMASSAIKDNLTLYGYGTLATNDGARLDELVVGADYKINERTNLFAEAGVNRGLDPKSDLEPTARAGVKISF